MTDADPVTDPAPPAGTVLAAAVADDAPEILVLQRCCWVTEAIVNDTLDIPPLHEDLDTVRAWLVDHEVWTLRTAGRLVGAVRARRAGDRWEIGRLMVAPDLRGRGVGRWLLEHVERRAPAGVVQFALFTGERSERNLRMYRRAGYVLSEPPPDFSGHHIRGAVALTRPAPGPDGRAPGSHEGRRAGTMEGWGSGSSGGTGSSWGTRSTGTARS